MLVLSRRPAREVPDAFAEIILRRGDETIRVRLVECSPSKARIGVIADDEWRITRGDSSAFPIPIDRKERFQHGT